jgi:preprotein translocase subunit SecD
MQRKLTARAILILAVVLVSVYGIIGVPRSVGDIRKNISESIRLGLDLRGGSHLVLQVQVQDAMKSEADQTMESMREELRKAGIDYAAMERNDPTTVEEADGITITVKGIPTDRTTAFRGLVAERYPNWVLTPVSSSDYRMTISPSVAAALKRDTVDRSIQTISTRINELGLTEPSVQQYGRAGEDHTILVQLPGVDDPARVKEIMQTTAQLEIVEVKDGPFMSREAGMAQHGGVRPVGTKFVRMSARAGDPESWYLVSSVPVIRGMDVRNARPGQDEFRKWETAFTLSQDAARRFGRFTEANVGNRLAVIMDNQIRSVATIQSRIDDSGRITGQASEQEASDLSLVLRSGALPAGVVFMEERTIGPSLGADSIQQGLLAGMMGLAAVIAAMLIYYKGAGVNAVVALVLNTLFLLAALSYFGAVLTLPGIAGIILSIGMAVDANVLIFERIREELRTGKSIPAAVETGFGKAWYTIVDANVTTIIACAFLFLFGEGPVRGFAVTLTIGLIANVFTAVYVSRTMFDWLLSRKRQVTALSI